MDGGDKAIKEINFCLNKQRSAASIQNSHSRDYLNENNVIAQISLVCGV